MKEDKLDKVVSAVVKAIDKRMNKKPKSYYTQAEVLRVDKQDKTAYVHIPGGVDQTPATLTIDAKVGDTVEVRVGEGRAFIVGNETNPPSDNETAEEAKETASSALSHSLESVVDDKLFYLASAQDTGVTVEDEGWTEEPQEPTALLPYLWVYHKYTRGSGSTFNSDPMIIAVYTEDGVSVTGVQPQYYLSTSSSSAVGGTWSNSLTYLSGYYIWTRNAISYSDGTTGYSTAIYDQALTEACSLSYNSAQYFWTKSSSNYTSCPTGSYVTEVSRDYYDPDKGGTVSGGSLLLRSAGIYIRNAATTVAQFLAAGVTLFNSSGYTLAEFLSSGLTVYNGSGTTIAHLGYGSGTSEGGGTANAPYYDLGIRSGTVGNYSVSEGNGTTASGYCSHAEGKATTASGTHSHAEGYYTTASGNHSHAEGNYTNASYIDQTAIGKYNSSTSGDLFEVGDGTSTSNRRNAFRVTDSGNAIVRGVLTAGGLSSTLFDTSEVSLSQSNATADTNYEIPSVSQQTGTVKSGYFPLGVVGYNVTSSGAYSRGAYLSAQADGACTVKARIYANTAGTKTCTVTVLWLKTSA